MTELTRAPRQQDTQKVASPQTRAQSPGNSDLKRSLRSMPYDAASEALTPNEGPPVQLSPAAAARSEPVVQRKGEGEEPAKTPDAGAPGADASGKTKGEQLRDKVHESAKSRYDNQTDIMSADEIKKQKGAFSTCTSFESQVMSDAESQMGMTGIADLQAQLNKLLSEEATLEGKVRGAEKSVDMAAKAVADLEAQIAKDQANPKLTDEQKAIRERYAQKGLADARAELARREAMKAERVKELEAKKAAEGAAYTHFEPGMKERPKPGDFIRIGIYKDRPYTANGVTVNLTRGSFLHVCVFDKLENSATNPDLDDDTEIWTTIDGGGQKPTIGLSGGPTTVKLKDRKIGEHLLLGWTNTAALVDNGLPK